MTYQIAHLRLNRSEAKARLPELICAAGGDNTFEIRSVAAPGAYSLSIQAFNNICTWQSYSEIDRCFGLRSTREEFCFKASARGQCVVRVGKRDIVVNPLQGGITDFSAKHVVDTGPGSMTYGFGISRHLIVEALQKLHGIPVPTGFEFEPCFDMRNPHVSALQDMLCLFQDDARKHRSLTRSAVAWSMFEETFSMFIVENFRHSLTDISNAAQHWLAPAQVRRAMEFAVANAAQPITVADMAAAAGVSVRALQANFQRFIERSPLEFLREHRLGLVRSELLAARNDHSVAMIAEKWGFLHQGRFAALYRRVYGRFPSEDLGMQTH